MPNDLRTHAIVLRRTNYGESDRILNLLTPEGKISALAKGVRKEKSKLAGGIELFSISDVVVHQGRGNLAILTSAKLLKFYSNILSDITKLELASDCLKKVEKASEQVDNPEYFDLIKQVFSGLHQNMSPELVKIWFTLNLTQAIGEDINLSTDVSGAPLLPDQRYFWDGAESALRGDPDGIITATQIKLARLILTSNLVTIAHINNVDELIQPLEVLVRVFG